MNNNNAVESITVEIADQQCLRFVDVILTTIADAAKVRGTGIARRSPEYIEQKIKAVSYTHLDVSKRQSSASKPATSMIGIL